MKEPISVLIVEGDMHVALEIQVALEDEGFDVFLACDFSEACRVLSNRSIELGVLARDLRIGGFADVAGALREAHVPFVLLSDSEEPIAPGDPCEGAPRLPRTFQQEELLGALRPMRERLDAGGRPLPLV